MSCSKRASWAAAAFIAALFLAPAVALCVEEDPYIYKVLIGRVYFEYQKNQTQSESSRFESSRFKQVYSLDTRGNYKSRNLLIYDAGISYTLDDYKTGAASSGTDSISYYGKTTLLPKSNIPLTLLGNRTESMGSDGSTSTSTGYGLAWTVRVRPLPVMSLSLSTNTQETGGTKQESDSFRFDAQKELVYGPTKNTIYFTKISTSSTGAKDTDLYKLNFLNNTKISKSTNLDFNATRNGSDGTTSEGYTVSLGSTPGIDFSQSQSYTYYSTKDRDGKQEGSAYAGGMSYRVSRDLNTSFNLAYNTSDSQSATTDRESKSLSSSGSIQYKLLSNVSLSESVSYTNFETNSSDQSAGGLSDYKSFSATTGLGYAQPLGWAFLSANYGLGYVVEKSAAGKGTGISQSVSLGLSNIDFNKYAVFNTFAAYSTVENTSGGVKSDSKSFSASAMNKIGAKYIRTSASYDRNMTTTWVPGGDSKNEGYRLNANTAYFKNTTLSIFADNTKSFNEQAGWATVMNEGLTLSHHINIFSSMLTANMELMQTERDYSGGKEKILTKRANAKYAKVIKRPIFWDIEGDWTEKKENNIVSRVTFIQNRFVYPLRAWLFSFEHKYILRETNIQDVSETIYLFKAMRTFVRFL